MAPQRARMTINVFDEILFEKSSGGNEHGC